MLPSFPLNATVASSQGDMEVSDQSGLLAYLMGVMFHFLWE